MEQLVVLGIYVVLFAVVSGLEMLRRVAPVLIPALRLVATALQGIVVVVAMLLLGQADTWWLQLVGLLAVVTGAAATVGGLVVADRMVAPYRAATKPRKRRGEQFPELPEGQR